MSRPVPVPTELTEPFWAAARQGKLVVPQCSDCGLRFFVPEPACPGCLSRSWTYQPSSGSGTVYSVTVVHRAPGPGFEVPFALAVVDLDDGATMLSHVVGTDPEQVAIGMRVSVDFRALTDEITLPYFTPNVLAESVNLEHTSSL
ncbi:Zn-ribbon domain-containing OB-fold protein [Streptomyces sp. NPDC005356]|uniref:Zn-ribbon domain-containing OB-fold protein n=1 Tax=Streptomyces sp. NPDC005356 TaxID=3157167 RepID=UPI0033A12578